MKKKVSKKQILTGWLVFMATITQTIIKWGFLRNEILQVLIKKEEKFKKTG